MRWKLRRTSGQFHSIHGNEDNQYTALATATARGAEGVFFTDIGDASPASCSTKLVPHLLRMASTRAKVRVLRDFTNTGICSIEELGEGELVTKQTPMQLVK